MFLVANEDFQHILRVLNTNVDGKQKIMFALTSIKGIGRRFSNIVCKKADVDMNKRAGELSAAELDNLMTIVANPRQFKIPDWFLNRQKDYKDGKYFSGRVKCIGHEVERRFGAFEEDQEPPWSEALLGSSCQGAAHKDYWPSWKDCWCL